MKLPMTPDVSIEHITKVKGYIEVVGSTNPRISAMSQDAREALVHTLRKKYTNVQATVVNNFADLENLVAKKPDLVVLGMKLVLLDPDVSYDESPKVWLSDFLRGHGINFTGSDTSALQFEFDKQVAKQKVIDAGLKSSAYFISTLLRPTFDHTLTFPLFVKPTNRGDSKGIDEQSVVYSQQELQVKIESIHTECSSDALIEEYLPGREFSVAVLAQTDTSELVAMPIEITAPTDARGHTFLSESVKESDSEKVIAVTDPVLRSALNNLAVGVFAALGSRDYGRIDVRLAADGAPSFIEANLMPGLSTHGYLARCFALNNSIEYDEMIFSIIGLALARDKPGKK